MQRSDLPTLSGGAARENTAENAREFHYDAFISYSRKDIAFARRLHQALQSYRPPKDLGVPQRTPRVFRDETDFVGHDYHVSLESNLQNAATLIVICSPNSASSEFVADEIVRFTAHRGKERLVTILLDGIPNNEAKQEESARRAFPEQLIRLLPMPLAADYRGFDLARDKISKGRFAPAWFKTLADVYAQYGVDRNGVEQREQKRRAERLRNLAAASSAIAIALVGLAIWALISRHEAAVQRDLATAGQREAEARLAFDSSGDGLIKATLLSAASLRSAQTDEGLAAMTRFLQLLPRKPEWRQPRRQSDTVVGGEPRHSLAFSPDGSRIASTDAGNEVVWLDAKNGRELKRTSTTCHPSNRTTLAFSPDNTLLAVGCAHQVCILNTGSDAPCRLLPDKGSQGDMVWAASFSPDSKLLATASYHSDEVFVYDAATWNTEPARIRQGQAVRATAISPDNKWLATTSNDGVRLWRLGEYQAAVDEVRTANDARSIAFDPDGDAFITGGNELVRWGIVSDEEGATRLQQQARLAINARTVLPVSWHGDSCFVAAASTAVSLLCGEELREVLRVPVSSVAATISPDGNQLINDEIDGSIAAWPLDGGVDVRRISVGAAVRSIALAKNQSWLAAGTDDGAVVIFDTQTWKPRERLHVPGAVTMLGVSNNGRWLFVSTAGMVGVFDVQTWKEIKNEKYPGVLGAVGFAMEDRLLIAVGDKSIVGLNTVDWDVKFEIAYDGAIDHIAIDPSGSKLAMITAYSGGHDSGVHLARVVDLGSGKPLGWEYTSGGGSFSNSRMQQLIAGHRSTAVGGDAALVAQSASWPSFPLRKADELVDADQSWSAKVSGRAISLSRSSTSRVIGEWDQKSDVTDELLLPQKAPRWLVSAGDDGLLRLWPLTANDLVSEACTRLKNILTSQAWTKLAESGTTSSCQLETGSGLITSFDQSFFSATPGRIRWKQGGYLTYTE